MTWQLLGGVRRRTTGAAASRMCACASCACAAVAFRPVPIAHTGS